MKFGPRTRVGVLLSRFPELETVLEWYRVRLDEVDYRLRIDQFCDRNDIDMDDLLAEFEAALSDDEDEDDDYDEDDDDDYDDDDDDEPDLDDFELDEDDEDDHGGDDYDD